ncbi:mechanosensitive ion channel domain-containing protein [Bordetella sp. 2513F-2]
MVRSIPVLHATSTVRGLASPSRPRVPWWRWWAALGMLLAMSWAALPHARAAAVPAENPPAERLTPAALADLLEDPQARNALIEQLRQQAGPAGQARDQADVSSLAARLADGTQVFLADLADQLGQATDALLDLFAGRGLGGLDPQRTVAALLGLAGVVLATVAAFWLLRLLATRAYARLDAWAARPPAPRPAPGAARARGPVAVPLPAHGWLRRAGAIVAALLIDLALVALAAIVGYAVGLYGVRPRGSIDTLQLLFVNAFVAVEAAKALIRGVFATRYPHLRLFAMDDGVAVYWNGWLSRIATLTGYGLLVAEPLVSIVTAPALGRLATLLIMLAVYVYALGGIWRNRLAIRQRLEAHAAAGFLGSRFRLLARVWHWLAIGYFTVLLAVSQVDPDGALPFMARATVVTLAVLALGMALNHLLSASLARRVRVSEDLRRRLPMLEARLNAYVPAAIRGVQILVRLVMALLVLDAWHAFDLSAWITSDAGTAVIRVVVNVAIVLFIAALVWTVIASIIEHRLNLGEGSGAPSAREKTLLSLFRNAAMIVIATLTVLIVLSQIGIDIAPLIAGAGVVGLAIGFGAQKLVQDIITGVFIQLENGMNQNDVVQVAGVFGTVEKLTIRSVGVRTLDGGYHLIPFSSVDVVSNHMRDFSYHLGEYTIAHRESVDEAIEHLRRAFEELMRDELLAPEVLEDISIPGVTAINEKGVTIRVLIKTAPGMQWAVQRAYNRLVKKHFEAAGIELPYPHTVVYFGQDKRGFAPAANVVVQPGRPDEGDHANAAGHTRRKLGSESGGGSPDVMGNELERVVDENGDPIDPRQA